MNYSEGSTPTVTTIKADVDHNLVRTAVKSGSIPMLELMIEQGYPLSFCVHLIFPLFR